LGNGVQYPGGALCGCDRNLAHLVGSNPAVWEFESPHPHSMPGRLTAGLLTLDQAIEVRILAGQLMPPRTAAAPPSYGGWPGSAPGGGSIPGGLASRPVLDIGARRFVSCPRNAASVAPVDRAPPR